MRVTERRSHLAIYDHTFFNNQVRNQGTDVLTGVEDWILPLWVGPMSTITEFDY